MADYISREAAVKLLTSIALEVPDSKSRTVAKCINRIELMPAADVEPVRHVPRKVWGIDEYYGEWLRCPNCGYEDNTVNAKYCGGCGSKMDLEVENDG